jgi:hypothetical protein
MRRHREPRTQPKACGNHAAELVGLRCERTAYVSGGGTAAVVPAGSVLERHQTPAPDAATRVLELLDEVCPPAQPSIYDCLVAERLRPLVGVEVTRAMASA